MKIGPHSRVRIAVTATVLFLQASTGAAADIGLSLDRHAPQDLPCPRIAETHARNPTWLCVFMRHEELEALGYAGSDDLFQDEETKILAGAQGKATTRLQAIKSQVGDEAATAGKALKSDAESLAGQIATKILGRELS